MSKPLTRCNVARPPSNIAILRCWSAPEPHSYEYTRHRMDGWRLTHLRLRNLEVQATHNYDGYVMEQLAATIRRCGGKHESVVLIGHDLRTDLQLGGVFQHIDEGLFRVNWIELAPRLMGQLSIDGFGIKLMDMQSWCDCTLEAAAKWYGVPAWCYPRKADSAEREFDVLCSLVSDWIEFGRTVAKGFIYPTTGRTAFEIWRNLYAPEDKATSPIWGNKSFLLPTIGDEYAKDCIPPSALIQPQVHLSSTGRVDGPIYDMDVKSFYPSLYLNSLQPAKFDARYENPKPELVRASLSNYWCIAKVSVGPHRHRLPIVHNQTIQWVYPPCETILAGDELAYYVGCGAIKWCQWLVRYSTVDYLSEFGLAMIAARNAAEKAGRFGIAQFVKRTSNSLWGRFAPKRNRWETVEGGQVVIPWGEWFTRVPGHEGVVKRRAIGNAVQEYRELGWSGKSWPAAAAFICAEARHYLSQIIDDAGERNIIYRVVDGLHTNQEGYNELSKHVRWIGTEPGRLRVVGVYPSATYYGRYTWEHPAGHRIAGLPSNGIQIEPGRYHATIYTGPAESYELGDLSSVYSRQRIFNYSHHGLDTEPSECIM